MRLIDADALAGKILLDAPGFLDGGSEITKAFIMAMINTRSVTPTIDAVPIIRCKDCKFSEKINSVYLCGKSREFVVHKSDWFCADGERKDSD